MFDMEPLELLKGLDSFKFIGAHVSVTMATGDLLYGELYCLDTQKGQTLVLQTEGDDESFSFHILRLSSIIKFDAMGPLNDTVYEIPRLNYDGLSYFKPILIRNEDFYINRID